MASMRKETAQFMEEVKMRSDTRVTFDARIIRFQPEASKYNDKSLLYKFRLVNSN